MGIKRSVFMTLVIAAALAAMFSSVCFASVDAGRPDYQVELPAVTQSAIDYSAISDVIANYFTYYYKSIEQLAVAPELQDYIADTDDTHLYLRYLEYSVDWRKEAGSGAGAIVDSKLERVTIKDATQRGGKPIEVVAYVGVGFRYLTDKSGTQSGVGDLWGIKLDTVDGSLKIVALDSQSSDYGWPKQLVDENLKKHGTSDTASSKSAGSVSGSNVLYSKKNAVDDAFVTMQSWMTSTIQGTFVAPTTPVDEPTAEGAGQTAGISSVLSVSVPYDAASAAMFGWLKGPNHDTGIFWNMEDVPGAGADCTNFVSQCLWCGYGGPNGNDWQSQTGMAACRLLAYQNFRQIPSSNPTPWWGASEYNPTPRLASNHWMRVDELYNHVQTTSAGPRGTHHNSGLTWQGSTLAVVPGNVLQLDQTGVAPYYHSVMVVSSSTVLGDPYNIYVAQHSGNYGYRQLYDVIISNGCNYVRMLRMLAGSFSS